MYKQHFGLTQRPFRAKAAGSDVFIGPSIAKTITAINKALSSNDAVACVSGPVGSGKTTLVMRALDAISSDGVIVRVARMQLNSQDVLDLLLDELGVTEKPAGTIQRFLLMRKTLKELEDKQTRLLIAIEDSIRLGKEALSEVEALTSADAGESEGASIVLMGDGDVEALLGEPELARLQQRVRQRLTLAPLSDPEMKGYLQHCFRLAGGDFDKIFESGAAELLNHLSRGIPRMTNSIVESALSNAADKGLQQVSNALISEIAESEYGLSSSDFTPAAQPAPAASPASDPAPAPAVAPAPAAVPEAAITAEPVPDVAATPEPAAAPASELELQFEQEPAAEAVPQAAAPAPEPAKDPTLELELVADFPPAQEAPPAVEPAPEPTPEPAAPVQPAPAAQAEAQPAAAKTPEADRDPTVHELKPDLDALEQAMALAKGETPEPEAPEIELEAEPEEPEIIPEITLDNSIDERVRSCQEEAAANAPAPEAAETPDEAASKSPNVNSHEELQKMAEDLARASSIEDIDDKLAETLFGEELNSIAAQFAVKPIEKSANDDAPEELAKPQQAAAPAAAAQGQVAEQSMTNSASQRLRTVQALNGNQPAAKPPAGAAPRPATAATPPQAAGAPTAKAPQGVVPGSIEDQMNSTLKPSTDETQTQRVLKVMPPEDNDSGDESKGGFFSRFKRS